ncbi:heavy metal-binding domain-containing protein [Rufibacter tibetensis]|nr:heavy metal-binding domain-containing protein [Rufibacter tibetensis]
MRKISLVWAMTLASVAFVSSCSNSSSADQPAAASTEEEATTPADSTSTQAGQQMAYICPMKCEGSASMEPGKCPVCSMNLEKNPDFHASADSTTAQ